MPHILAIPLWGQGPRPWLLRPHSCSLCLHPPAPGAGKKEGHSEVVLKVEEVGKPNHQEEQLLCAWSTPSPGVYFWVLELKGYPIPSSALLPPVGLQPEATQLLGAFPFPKKWSSAAWLAVSRSADKETCPWRDPPDRLLGCRAAGLLLTSRLQYCDAGLAACVLATGAGAGLLVCWALPRSCPLPSPAHTSLLGRSVHLHRQDLSFQF